MVQNLRNLHIKNQKLFDHIIILTHRINLDDQISKDFLKAIGQTGVVAYCKNTNDLKLVKYGYDYGSINRNFGIAIIF